MTTKEFCNIDNYLRKKWEVYTNKYISQTITSVKSLIQNKCPESFDKINKKRSTPESKNDFNEYMRNQDILNFQKRLKHISSTHSDTYNKFLRPKNESILNKKLKLSQYKPSIFPHEKINLMLIKEDNSLLRRRLRQSKSFFNGNDKLYKINIFKSPPQSTRLVSLRQTNSKPFIIFNNGKELQSKNDIELLLTQNIPYRKKRFINGLGLSLVIASYVDKRQLNITIRPFCNKNEMFTIIFDNISDITKIQKKYSSFDNFLRGIFYENDKLLINSHLKFDYVVKIDNL